MLKERLLTEEDKKEICSWQYEGEYEMYNLPSYEELKEKQFGFCNPKREKCFYAFLDEDSLVGFTNIVEEEKEVFIGIGVNPTICGKGYGQEMLKITSTIVNKLYPNKPLYLEVRSWNKRAVNCYLKAGFKIDGEEFTQETHIGEGVFYRMIKEYK